MKPRVSVNPEHLKRAKMSNPLENIESPNAPGELLSELIKFNTTNPPGNELGPVTFIKELLESHGLETIIKAKDPNRPNLITRIKGHGASAPLLFYGHVDVVTTKGQQWEKPPFEGFIQDGWVWGRGALDMKSGLSMMILSILRTVKSNFTPKGDIILAILSDEEKSSHFGSKFLVSEHSGLFSDVKYAIGEFGGFPLYFGHKTMYAVQVGEKQACGVRAKFRGSPGHGAQPIQNGAMAKLGRFLTKIDSQPFSPLITKTPRMMINSIADYLPVNEGVLFRQLLDPGRTDSTLALMGTQGRLFWPMLHNTVSPTIVQGSDKINVIPAEVVLDMDTRLLPGQSPENILVELERIAEPGVEFEIMRFEECPDQVDMGLFPLLGKILSDMDEGSIAVPYLLSGITDARILAKLGIQTYGWLPMNLPKDFNFFSTVHGANERIPVECVEFGARAMERLIKIYEY